MEEQNPYASPLTSPAPEQVIKADRVIDYADRGSRFAAALIDMIIFSVILLLADFVFWHTGWFSATERQLVEIDKIAPIAYTIATIIFILINYHLWETRGQSIGKLALGIKIIRTDGREASVGRIIGHRFLIISVIGFIPVIGSIISFVNPVLIFRRERNCLHDDIADTRAIRVQPKPVAS